jgi:predicted site-specific integrase-resolvase
MPSTETYEHTISGLLQRRHELLQEMAAMREHMAALTNDIQALDHVLSNLGYKGKEVEPAPRVPRLVLFYRGQLQQFLLSELRELGEATTRDLALKVMRREEKDARDQRLVHDFISRIGKALQRMHNVSLVAVTRSKKRGQNIWRLSS